MSKSPITCHVLDSSTGKPAAEVQLALQVYHRPIVTEGGPEIFQPLSTSATDADGRCTNLLPIPGTPSARMLKKGDIFKLTLETKKYFESTGRTCFYPHVEITFEIGDPIEHYHIPLIISPYGFTTYRGS